MGDTNVSEATDNRRHQAFIRALLDDVRAMERMLDEGIIEDGIRRIGAEQEMFLVDDAMRPASANMQVLEQIKDPRLTHELAQFNIEANASPRVFGGSCLKDMEEELQHLVQLTDRAARNVGARVLLTGILPTLRRSDLTLDNITPVPRYRVLNDTLHKLRGGAAHIWIKGLDELEFTHDNVMLEACNTSFQVHFQVSPGQFAELYNVAQAVTAPLMAVAVNSPLLFGNRLWAETRLALFQRSVDARSESIRRRGQRQRVHFGDRWVDNSVMEIIKEDVARFRIILAREHDENPLKVLDRGELPKLSALCLHNGTIWRWNRACYGIGSGRAHLRIENRILPSGPTILDEMANAAFFFGLMSSMSDVHQDIRQVMQFDDAKANFFSAARLGLKAQFTWLKGKQYSAADLILQELVPMARAGLERGNIDPEDIDRYLGVIEERVKTEQTGSRWILDSMASMDPKSPLDVRFRTVTAAIAARQEGTEPVHTWPLARVEDRGDWRHSYLTVDQFMTTDLFTVRPHDLVDLAASVMEWRHIRHVPVEDDDAKLIGLVSYRDLLTLISQGGRDKAQVPVTEIMTSKLISVSPDTTTLEALRLMQKNDIGCLPVVEDGKLVGLVTTTDLLAVATELLTKELSQS